MTTAHPAAAIPVMTTTRPWSQLTQIFRHIAELLQYNRVQKLANVPIACTLECDGPGIGRIPGHSFGTPDRGALALALLCFTRRSTVFGADEVWAVFADTNRYAGMLTGTYTGASAEVSIAAGLGANVLVGGSNRTVALQPLSVQGQIGLDIAAGIGQLELHPFW